MYFQSKELLVVLNPVIQTTETVGEMNLWFILGIALIVVIGSYILIRLYLRRLKIQRRALEKKVDKRTSEISRQKEELKKAYEEIKTKNIAIEEAFEHLTNSFAKLSDVNREKDGIIGIVAHDLRTPLNNIEGLIQLVSMDGNLTDDQIDYISKIRLVVKHGNEMIRDLLDISQNQHQVRELSLSKFNIHDFIENWRISFADALSSKKQKLVLGGDYQSVEMNTDAGLLSRILDNLMSNAIKFSNQHKTVNIEINAVDDKVKIIISDEGPGISEEDQAKMFKPFTRLSAQPTAGEPSNGLGLSIIKNLSKQLGGKIEVRSQLGLGTSFDVTIPIDAELMPKKPSWSMPTK
ncbi:MAG: HAMP domain-containing sensor histidine kinase [Reichenbachiella sp.]|uniref:sensor histidine kinase n=1 Tax=Reichenbachiella sp. TaxID=2184521 RepID=UPI003264FD2E